MRHIQRLHSSLASKIAAGEVIERPVSVVKELLENSIDAAGTRITVSVFQGGKSDIIVEDDGTGIPVDELELAVESHATSKISAERDLESISTLGYRGEALWSISSVSRLEIRSRTPDSSSGGILSLQPGEKEPRIDSINCSPGTRVQVSDLFFNLPARRKFQGSARGEFTRISRLVRDFALLYPETGFTLIHDDRDVFSSLGCNTKREVLESIWGDEPSVLYYDLKENGMEVEVWYQPFSGKRVNISTFVNGRIVRDPVIRAAANACDAGLSGNLAVFLNIPSGNVDVNIHPAKAEVRFKNSSSVFESVRNAVTNVAGSSVQEGRNILAGSSKSGLQSMPFSWNGRSYTQGTYDSLTCRVSAPPPFEETSEKRNIAEEEKSQVWQIDSADFEDVTYTGQMRAGYLVFEKGRTLLLMDLHAAHERINFERVKASFEKGIKKQVLTDLQPVSPSLSEFLEEHAEELSEAGFGFVKNGGSWFISEIPTFLADLSLGTLEVLRSLIAELESCGSLSTSLERTLWLKWADMACKRSIKLTSRMEAEEALSLYRQLEKCNNPLFCPHGRPTLIFLDLDRLTREFGRK